jgi:hypothetical protein
MLISWSTKSLSLYKSLSFYTSKKWSLLIFKVKTLLKIILQQTFFNIEYLHYYNKLWVNEKLISKNPKLMCFCEIQNSILHGGKKKKIL